MHQRVDLVPEVNSQEQYLQEIVLKIGKAFRCLRKEKGWTLAHVSGITGVSIGYISQVEIGNNNHPSLRMLLTLSSIYGCSLGKLLTNIEDKKDEPRAIP